MPGVMNSFLRNLHIIKVIDSISRSGLYERENDLNGSNNSFLIKQNRFFSSRKIYKGIINKFRVRLKRAGHK